jgi:benzodiazapine receptor
MTNHAKHRSFPRYLLRTGLAVAAAAVLGGVATDPDSSGYRRLRKPRWQPPAATFGVVWPPLYALIAYAGARSLAATEDRAPLARSLAVNLALNTAWTPIFFRAHAPRLALATLAALNAANADLLRRCARADRRAAVALTPYVAWTAFATALNAAIAARNPRTA